MKTLVPPTVSLTLVSGSDFTFPGCGAENWLQLHISVNVCESVWTDALCACVCKCKAIACYKLKANVKLKTDFSNIFLRLLFSSSSSSWTNEQHTVQLPDQLLTESDLD